MSDDFATALFDAELKIRALEDALLTSERARLNTFALLGECERAFVRVRDYSSDPHLVNLADDILDKLRGQEKADETE